VGIKEILDVLLGLLSFLGVWVLNTMWRNMKELEEANEKIVEKLQSLELQLVRDFAKKADVDENTKALFQRFGRLEERMMEKLDIIRDKLDQKADKP